VIRLLEGRYEGSPAVLGVVVSGPGAGEPPDRAEVLVADRRDCSILVGTTVQF
jgi:hypothetical protein